MNIWRFDNANSLYYAMISALGEEVKKIVAAGRDPVILLPTGNTMIPFYHLVIQQQEELSVSKWRCFNLDEYYPLPVGETSEPISYSFQSFMTQHFYGKLNPPPALREFLRGNAPDAVQECSRFEMHLHGLGDADLAILGIGTNGHIAFNEPHSEFTTRTRLVELHPQTLMANFKNTAPVTHALTVGLETLMESKKIFIVALGKNKSQAVRCAIKDPQSRSCPASVLQKHGDVTWFVDQEAADLV